MRPVNDYYERVTSVRVKPRSETLAPRSLAQDEQGRGGDEIAADLEAMHSGCSARTKPGPHPSFDRQALGSQETGVQGSDGTHQGCLTTRVFRKQGSDGTKLPKV